MDFLSGNNLKAWVKALITDKSIFC